MIFELCVILGLICLNGVLAMSELAIVSARPARLKPIEAKSRGAAAALRLAEHPGRFLSTVQIGITLVGVLSGALSGATLGARLSQTLIARGVDPEWAANLGVGGVVVGITYVSLIIGELVPKQLALRNPEGLAIVMAPAMLLLSKVAAPVVWLLDRSGRVVLWLMGQRGASTNRVTEEEVRSLLAEAHEVGVLEDEEREMMAGVMRMSDRSARALMTPRRDVDMLDLGMSSAEVVVSLRRNPRARLPVQNPETGEVLGIITLADAFGAVSRREALDLQSLMVEVPVISDRTDALAVLDILRSTPYHMALVYDEYGTFEGIITSGDVLEAITGAQSGAEADEPALVMREDGSFLVSGWMPADEFCDRFDLPRSASGEYDTVAGLVLHQMGRLPNLGDSVTFEGHRIEVIDLDGMRIDKLLVTVL